VCDTSGNTRNPKTIDWVAQADDAAAFIGPNAEYYITQFQRIDEKELRKTWSWAGFFGGIWWSMYRKIFLYSLGTEVSPSFVTPFGLAVYANWIYKQRVEDELVATAEFDPVARREHLKRRGGATIRPFILIISIPFVVFSLSLS